MCLTRRQWLQLRWVRAFYALGCLCLPVFAQERALDSRAAYVASVGAVVGAAAWDIHSSMPHPGVREGNPILGQMDARGIAIKSAITGVVLLVTHHIRQQGHPRLATVLNLGIAIGTGAVAYRNTQVGR